MLQQSLHKSNVIAIVAVDLRCVPFSETVSADAFITQIVTNARKDFLYFSCGYGKDDLIASNVIAKTIVFYILLDNKWNSKYALFACFLLDD